MSRIRFASLRNERGASLAVVAVMTVGILAVTALAIDLGMLYRTRGEAQRAADAAALAGASTYLEMPSTDPAADDSINARAYRLATANHMTGGPIQPAEVAVQHDANAYRVDVWVRRASIPTWFARIFGVNSVPIGAHAAAAAVASGSAKCLKPMAIADMWHETYLKVGQGSKEVSDTNFNRWEDNNEFWDYTPASAGGTDTYAPINPYNRDDPTATGYGSAFRNGNGMDIEYDFGLPLVLKENKGGEYHGPGWYGPWRFPGDTIDYSGTKGAEAWREAMVKDCPTGVEDAVSFDDTVRVEPGNMVGPAIGPGGKPLDMRPQYDYTCQKGAFRCLIELDENASWDEATGQVLGSSFSNWRDSPRVIKVAVFSPEHLLGLTGGYSDLTFNNFVLLFLDRIENVDGNQGDEVIARFLYSLPGAGEPGGGPNTLVRRLVLVE